jgi:hypothetical protein
LNYRWLTMILFTIKQLSKSRSLMMNQLKTVVIKSRFFNLYKSRNNNSHVLSNPCCTIIFGIKLNNSFTYALRQLTAYSNSIFVINHSRQQREREKLIHWMRRQISEKLFYDKTPLSSIFVKVIIRVVINELFSFY